MVEANQELPTWLESIGMDSRFSFGGRRSGAARGGRFRGTGFGAKDVRYENGKSSPASGLSSGMRPSLGGGGWCGPPGLRSGSDSGGSYSTAGGPDWW